MVINLGGEMMYILEQRLVAQKIPPDKARKVMPLVLRFELERQCSALQTVRFLWLLSKIPCRLPGTHGVATDLFLQVIADIVSKSSLAFCGDKAIA